MENDSQTGVPAPLCVEAGLATSPCGQGSISRVVLSLGERHLGSSLVSPPKMSLASSAVWKSCHAVVAYSAEA